MSTDTIPVGRSTYLAEWEHERDHRTRSNAAAIDGDHDHFQDRSPTRHRRLFAEAGLVPMGLHVYVTKSAMHTLTALELGSGGEVGDVTSPRTPPSPIRRWPSRRCRSAFR